MAIYSLAQATANVTIANSAWEIRTTSTDRAYALEIGFFSNTATATVVGVGRPAAIGVGPTGTATVQAEDFSSPAGTVTGAISWATSGPTVPAQFFRRVQLPATIGSGVIYTFPRGLIIPVSAAIVLWNISASVILQAHIVVDE